MPNIVVTSTTDYIKVDFGDYYPNSVSTKVSYYNRNELQYIAELASTIEVHFLDSRQDWTLSYDAQGGAFIVDKVDTVAPTSNADLATKIAALIKA